MLPDPMVVYCRYCQYARAPRFDTATGVLLDLICQQCGRDFELLSPQELHERELREQAEAIAKALSAASLPPPKRDGYKANTKSAAQTPQKALLSKRATARLLGIGRSDTLPLLVKAGLLHPVSNLGKQKFDRREVEQLSHSSVPSHDELRKIAEARTRAGIAPQVPGTTRKRRRARPVDSNAGTLENWQPPERKR